ncbi:hypothetical protein TcCL_Unassigned03577 [Trypanosoma cruzi]|nr:hypothetical protein TcCL_Unassigned03577 [Trypanosoma cruzi]
MHRSLYAETLNSFHVNENYGIIHGLHNNFNLLFPEKSPIHIARDQSKEKSNASSPTVIPRWRSKHNPKKCRKSSCILHRPSATHEANAQHGRRVMLTNT